MKTFKINFEFTFKKTVESDETGPTDQDLIAYMKGKSTLSDCIRYEDYIEDLFEDRIGEIKYSKGVVSFKIQEGEFCSVQEILDFLNTVSPYGHQPGDEVYYPSKNGEVLGKIGIKNLNVK